MKGLEGTAGNHGIEMEFGAAAKHVAAIQLAKMNVNAGIDDENFSVTIANVPSESRMPFTAPTATVQSARVDIPEFINLAATSKATTETAVDTGESQSWRQALRFREKVEVTMAVMILAIIVTMASAASMVMARAQERSLSKSRLRPRSRNCSSHIVHMRAP